MCHLISLYIEEIYISKKLSANSYISFLVVESSMSLSSTWITEIFVTLNTADLLKILSVWSLTASLIKYKGLERMLFLQRLPCLCLFSEKVYSILCIFVFLYVFSVSNSILYFLNLLHDSTYNLLIVSVILSIFSLILFIFSLISCIFILILLTFSVILFKFSLIFEFSLILFIFSPILFILSLIYLISQLNISYLYLCSI